jgi:class 3 adenylate cyclase
MTTIERFTQHAPLNWQGEITESDFQAALAEGRPVRMIVLCADIRKSTLLMKEAIDFRRFAHTIGGFVTAGSTFLRKKRGWFDKFTGDGFLMYWMTCDRDPSGYFDDVMRSAYTIINTFRDRFEPEVRKNVRNFPDGVGISIGIDIGETYLVEIADDLTIVGPAVVGAVRMVGVAKPYEAVVNIHLGELMLQHADVFQRDISLHGEMRRTKEFPEGQFVYAADLAEDREVKNET